MTLVKCGVCKTPLNGNIICEICGFDSEKWCKENCADGRIGYSLDINSMCCRNCTDLENNITRKDGYEKFNEYCYAYQKDLITYKEIKKHKKLKVIK